MYLDQPNTIKRSIWKQKRNETSAPFSTKHYPIPTKHTYSFRSPFIVCLCPFFVTILSYPANSITLSTKVSLKECKCTVGDFIIYDSVRYAVQNETKGVKGFIFGLKRYCFFADRILYYGCFKQFEVSSQCLRFKFLQGVLSFACAKNNFQFYWNVCWK